MRTRDKLDRQLKSPGAPPTRFHHESLHRLEREVLGQDAIEEDALSIKERLERLLAVTTAARNARAGSTRLIDDDGRTNLPAWSDRPGRRVSLDEVLEGRRVENERGAFYQVEQRFPLDHWHGRMSLSRLKVVPPSAFSVLARGAEGPELDLSRAVFLDTETTGLAGGSGTSAFLIGLGYLEDNHFVVRQLFMRDYPEEESMLHELVSMLSGFESLVTFNGKAFDIPLLESRLVLSRLRYPLGELPHFDLLHPARSLWKARLESCRLTDLEYVLLDLRRDEDVPSNLIPSLYFEYLRTRDASRVFRVFTHNRYDIVSLAALTVRASEMLEEEASPEHPMDDYSLGRLFERAALTDRSIRHYSRAVESGLTGRARRQSLRRLALQLKRREEWEGSIALCKELAAEEGPEAIEALEDLAKHLEHRERDVAGALAYCQEAMSRLEEDLRLPLAFRERWRDAFRRRVQRLKRREGK
ncbi:MAG: ribonuclease H-like domain-containing protein [Vicinamibacteria bacterium]